MIVSVDFVVLQKAINQEIMYIMAELITMASFSTEWSSTAKIYRFCQ